MAVTMNARWDDSGTVIPGGDAEYVVAEQPIAEYDNWFNYNIVADIQAVIDDVINRFDANTILKADTDNTPAALVVAEQTIVGRKTGNSIAALTDTEVRTILNVEDGSTADQSDAEIRAAVEAATDSNVFTDDDHTKLNSVDTDADVTGSANVAAAGAVMDADFSATEGFMRKTGAGAYTTVKSNIGAAVAPTVDDDTGDGYGVGSSWFDTTADKAYVCLDNSAGAAVWKETSLADHHLEHVEGGNDVITYYDRFADEDLFSNDTSRTVTAGSYTKYKETKIDDCSGTIRFRYTIYAPIASTIYGKLYKNGVAAGAENSASHQTSTFTEDISGCADGDLIQVYCYKTGSNCTVSNFKVRGENIILAYPPTSIASQDP